MYFIYSIFLYFLVCDSIPSILAHAVSQISSSLLPGSIISAFGLTESTTVLASAGITTQTSVASSPFTFSTPTELSEPIDIRGTPDPGLSSSSLSQILLSESNPRATSTTIEWIITSLPPSTSTTTIKFPLSGSETTLSESGTSASASTPSSINTVTSEVLLSTPQSTSLVSSPILTSAGTSVFSVSLSTSNSTVLTPSVTGISVIPTESAFSSDEPSSIAPSTSSGTGSSDIEPLASCTAIITTDSSITTLFTSESFTANSSTITLPESASFSAIEATSSTVVTNPSISDSSVILSVSPLGPSSFESITIVPSASSSENDGRGPSLTASGSNGSSPSASGSGNGTSSSDSIATITLQSSTIESNTTIAYQSVTPTAATDTVPSAKTSHVPSIIETAASLTVVSLGTNPSGLEPTSSAEFSVSSNAIVSSGAMSEFAASTTNPSTVQVKTELNPGVSHTSFSSTIEIANSTLEISTTPSSSLTDLVPSLSSLDKTFSSDIETLVSTTSTSISGFFIELAPTMTTLIVPTFPISTSPAPSSPPSVESSAQSLSASSAAVTVSFLPGNMAESTATTYLSSIYTLMQVYTRSSISSMVEPSSNPILPN
ncbi:uncharacterized protein EAF01_011158 [Botrytis porri]|uniref:REJ domain-containing protein n=1 Tax=Botrytis porri TaxID=87229 RepID=A0A4Z1KB13_9HELO|nr:uncharacterized protein EAF01_011158 [Botrytis porri]KAF7888004.1 hypothetical protein EAF01_011158 [Botrytis porri]TGO83341.1 hypothetical protein BPOR_0661g00040 [Botrytis porri]